MSRSFIKVASAIADVQSRLTVYEFSVFMNIAFHINWKTQESFPSYETISEKTGLDRKTVAKAIKGLKDKGFITITKRCGHNVYRLLFVANGGAVEPIVPAWAAPSNGTGVVPSEGTTVVPSNGTEAVPADGTLTRMKKEEGEEATPPLSSFESSEEEEMTDSNDKVLETSSGLASTDVGSFKENQQQNSLATKGRGRESKLTKKKDEQLTPKQKDALERLNKGLRIGLDPRWDKRVVDVAKFITEEEENGRMLDAFLKWVSLEEDSYDKALKYSSFPQDIMVHWPMAQSMYGRFFSPEPLPEPHMGSSFYG